MSRFLVVTQRHGLIPLAHRLRLGGHEVDLITWQHAYEQSWSGSFARTVRGSKGHLNRDSLKTVLRTTAETDAVLLHDVPVVGRAVKTHAKEIVSYGQQKMADAPKNVLRLGAWFDGEQFTHRHLLLYDMGAWPGNVGPQIPGGVTLVNEDPPALRELLDSRADEMKAAGFRGLCQVGARPSEEGSWDPDGLWAGWPPLHTHAFVSELENFAEVLTRGAAPDLSFHVVVVIPMSVQPYPWLDFVPYRLLANLDLGALGRSLPIEVPDPELLGKVFWHDVVVDPEGKRLRTGAMDGLIGVARGAGTTPTSARSRAVAVAGSVDIDGLQWRPDVGARADIQLAELEKAGILG